jgi:hypothetical protein
MKKNREEPHQNPQFWHLVPKRALSILRDFPPSGTLYHFFSRQTSVPVGDRVRSASSARD